MPGKLFSKRREQKKKLAVGIVRQLEGNPNMTKRNLLEDVARLGGTNAEKLICYGRNEDIVFIRHAAYYLACRKLGMTLQETAYFFGRKDHTTVINGVRVMEAALKEYSLTDSVTS